MLKSKENAVLYPYGLKSAPIVRHKNLSEKYDIVSLVSPIGWGLAGKDAGCTDLGTPIGITVHSDFEKAIEDCGTVIIADCDVNEELEAIIYENVDLAISRCKNIVSLMEFGEGNHKKISEKCKEKNLRFEYIVSLNKDFEIEKQIEEKEVIKPIPVPVVFVMALAPEVNKFEIQLSLRESLLGDGYKVAQIGSRRYCEFFGFRSFPNFMFDKELSGSKRIVLFNKYIRHLQAVEDPDIVVIGIPKSIMPYTTEYTNGFGLIAYEVSQAVQPDFSILSVLYDKYDNSYFELMSNVTKYRFGFGINCFNCSNTDVDYRLSEHTEKLCFNRFPSDFIEKSIEKYEKYKIPVLNVFNDTDKNRMKEVLVNTLSDYSKMEKVSIGGI